MKTLLLVDDDIAIVKQLHFALASEYKVLEATSKEEALNLIDNNTIDIALVDLGLPPFENSHKEGLAIIKYLLQNSFAKVLVLTGQTNQQYLQELIALGVFDYLSKPVDLEKLKHALQRASFFLDHEKAQESQAITLHFHTSLENGLKGSADKAQRELLLKILKQTHFNINQTAKILGISRENCYYFLKKFDIQRPHDD